MRGRVDTAHARPTHAGTERMGASRRPMNITGHPIVFNSPSVDLGGFVETINPAAVDRTLEQRADVVALWNHDSNHPLGRTSARSLTLQKDARGLGIDLFVDERIS